MDDNFVLTFINEIRAVIRQVFVDYVTEKNENKNLRIARKISY